MNEYTAVIGIIDSYGAIHSQGLRLGEYSKITHDSLWPTQTHKRWRFVINDWQVQQNVRGEITQEEAISIEDHCRKKYQPPLWVIKGDEWDAIGRPRSGKKYESHCKKWDEIYKQKCTRTPSD